MGGRGRFRCEEYRFLPPTIGESMFWVWLTLTFMIGCAVGAVVGVVVFAKRLGF